mmetsp:Transcript_22683/g.40125  ORF Transcript_22683/g.40125 Transcript_22683/m.40125 type:complete len:200 (-) Transcript_22683:32-631(-)
MALIVFHNKISDYDKLNSDYLPTAIELLTKAGAKILSVDENCEVIEGKTNLTRTVLIRFASVQAAKDFYNLPEYQKVVPIRKSVTSAGFAKLVEGSVIPDTKAAVYLVFHNSVKEIKKLNDDYVPKAVPTLGKFKAELVALDDNVENVEGNTTYHRCVVLQFPSAELAKGWYNSKVYEPVRQLRLDLQQEGFCIMAKAM